MSLRRGSFGSPRLYPAERTSLPEGSDSYLFLSTEGVDLQHIFKQPDGSANLLLVPKDQLQAGRYDEQKALNEVAAQRNLNPRFLTVVYPYVNTKDIVPGETYTLIAAAYNGDMDNRGYTREESWLSASLTDPDADSVKDALSEILADMADNRSDPVWWLLGKYDTSVRDPENNVKNALDDMLDRYYDRIRESAIETLNMGGRGFLEIRNVTFGSPTDVLYQYVSNDPEGFGIGFDNWEILEHVPFEIISYETIRDLQDNAKEFQVNVGKRNGRFYIKLMAMFSGSDDQYEDVAMIELTEDQVRELLAEFTELRESGLKFYDVNLNTI